MIILSGKPADWSIRHREMRKVSITVLQTVFLLFLLKISYLHFVKNCQFYNVHW